MKNKILSLMFILSLFISFHVARASESYAQCVAEVQYLSFTGTSGSVWSAEMAYKITQCNVLPDVTDPIPTRMVLNEFQVNNMNSTKNLESDPVGFSNILNKHTSEIQKLIPVSLSIANISLYDYPEWSKEITAAINAKPVSVSNTLSTTSTTPPPSNPVISSVPTSSTTNSNTSSDSSCPTPVDTTLLQNTINALTIKNDSLQNNVTALAGQANDLSRQLANANAQIVILKKSASVQNTIVTPTTQNTIVAPVVQDIAPVVVPPPAPVKKSFWQKITSWIK